MGGSGAASPMAPAPPMATPMAPTPASPLARQRDGRWHGCELTRTRTLTLTLT